MQIIIGAGALGFGLALLFVWALCRASKNGDLMMEECSRVEALRRLLEKHE